ncbi:glucokinase [Solilutibacter silvestris]|uniref:Glucokinase n=1 Tax=Solilutibacter silvestris TaxID=1645665 RepID=A0A2K1PZ20_9GAMM|nr:glucokinase [Lysobacter silvestris]PNS08033.1 Glucokinase [Lysobacter silvestris]
MTRTDNVEFLAADIGGTHARVARVACRDGRIVVLEQHVAQVSGTRSLAALLEHRRSSITHAAIAVAGVVNDDGDVLSEKLPWPISASRVANEAGLAHVGLVNDFEAVAHAIPHLREASLTHVCGPVGVAGKTALALGPGTGMGSALRLDDGRVIPSEAGHAALAVGTPRECDLLRWLLQQRSHVDNDRVLSGPGLLEAYRGLCSIDAVTPLHASPADVVTAASTRSDRHALEAVELFCAMLGSFAGDLVVTFNADAVYLAGGVAAHVKPFLLDGGFAKRFVDKGVLHPMMERVPVCLVEEPHLGVIGAAAWYLERHDLFSFP